MAQSKIWTNWTVAVFLSLLSSVSLTIASNVAALFSAFFCVSVMTAQSCDTRYRNASIFYTYVLTSPNYPSDYPSSTTCEWIITAPSGYRVELNFVTFNTEGSYVYYSLGSCNSYSDTLEVYDGRYSSSSKLRGKYCKNYLPANVYSSGRSLYLRFVSHSSSQRKGFKIKYKAVIPKPDSSICSPYNTDSQNNNIQLSGSSGYIESPLYGTKYPSNMQCTWVITVPDGKKIKLTFSDFTVGDQDSYCNAYYSTHDKLEIRDGQYSFSNSLKKLCGNSLPSPVYSSGRYLWIWFKSKSYNYNKRNNTGFKAKYETQSKQDSSICSPFKTYSQNNNIWLSGSGYIESPLYGTKYPSNMQCTWVITVPEGKKIKLTFSNFTLGESYNCSSSHLTDDQLQIWEGQNSSSTSPKTLCGKRLPSPVYSSARYLWIQFKSKSNNYNTRNNTGFKAKYETISSTKPDSSDSSICSPFNTYSQNNNIQLSGSSGYIESPLYGTKYPSNMQCTWVITVPEGRKIKLTFLDFNVGQNFYTCSERHDYVQIRDGRLEASQQIGQYCSSSKPSPIHSSGRYMWIRFKSNSDNYLDESGNTNGFRARYEDEMSSAVGAIIGIVIAIVVVTFLIVVCLRKRKRRLQNRAQMTQPSAPSYPTVHYSPTPQSSYPPPSSGHPSPQVSYQHPPPGSTGDAVSTPQPSAPINDHPSGTFLNDPPPAYPEVVPDVPPPPYPGISPNPSHISTTQHPTTS